jgi:hypothetical protein
VTLAAYLHRGAELPTAGSHVVLVSGGSVDVALLADVLTAGAAARAGSPDRAVAG